MPAWSWAEHWAIIKCLFTGRIIDGPDKDKLYTRLSELTGVKYVFGFNSGQEAIQAALMAGGICKGDKVIMPSYCCETVAKAIVNSGATPSFCDIGDDYNPDVSHVLSILIPSVKAIIFPHLFGNPGRIDKLEIELKLRGKKSSLLLIDDAAQSFGATLNGKLLGTFGDAGIISFGPGKTMTATGGGVLVTNSEKLAKRLKVLAAKRIRFKYKIRRIFYWVFFRRWRKFTLPFLPFFEDVLDLYGDSYPGIFELSNIDSAIALKQLKKLEKMLKLRIERMGAVDDWLRRKGLSAFCEPIRNFENGVRCVCTKYVMLIKEGFDAEKLQTFQKDELERKRIEIKPLYIPIHTSKTHKAARNELPRTEALCTKILQVPIEPSINGKRFQEITQVLERVFSRYFDGSVERVSQCTGRTKLPEHRNHATS